MTTELLATQPSLWGTPKTPWDRRIFARASVTAIGAWLVCLLIVTATDEGGVAWATRLGRSLTAAPICAAISVALTTGVSRGRGELRALASLGRSERESAKFAILGGIIPGLFLAALAMLAIVDVTSFFPAPDAHKIHLHVTEEGFIDDDHHILIGAAGSFSNVSTKASSASDHASLPLQSRLAAATTVALSSVVFALAFAVPEGRARIRRAVWAAFCSIISIAIFQLSAADHLPALLGALPQAALLGFWRAQERRFLDRDVSRCD